jgi:hypothetical protein
VQAETLVALVRAAARVPAAHPASVQEGDLRDVLLLDLLSSLVERLPTPGTGRDAEITLESHGRSGMVAVVDGELVHAACDGDIGRHALERLCCWREGGWRLDPVLFRGAPTLTGASIGLLAVAQDYARRVELAREGLPYVDLVCAVRWERARPLPVVAEAMFRRIGQGGVLSEALTGEGDDELEAFAALETRIRRGAIVPQRTAGQSTLQVQGSDSWPPQSPTQPELARHRPVDVTASQGLRAVPMTPVAAPQVVPERRRKHLTTHTYRVLDERDIAGVPTEAVQPVALPPQPVQPRPQIPLPGAPKGMLTGWFGGDEAEDVQLSAADLAQATPPLGLPSLGLPPVVGATGRPVAPRPSRRSAGRWLAMAGALVVVGSVAWWQVSLRRLQAPAPKTDVAAYSAALDLSDAGKPAEAIVALRQVVAAGGAGPEALLNLGVLELANGQRDVGRQHLDAYLQTPGAHHVAQVRSLIQQVWGP